MKNKIVLVNGLNWQGIYVDGKLLYEDSVITAKDCLVLLKIPFKREFLNETWLEVTNKLPKDLKDVRFDVKKGD